MTLKHPTSSLLMLPVAAILLAGTPQPVQADPPFGNPGRGGPSGAGTFGHGGFCPPGLRDKGCVPPGLQKFHRGDRIPDFRSYDRLGYREYGLPYPGDDRRYIRIGNEAYLVAEATQRVIEVINLLNR